MSFNWLISIEMCRTENETRIKRQRQHNIIIENDNKMGNHTFYISITVRSSLIPNIASLLCNFMQHRQRHTVFRQLLNGEPERNNFA